MRAKVREKNKNDMKNRKKQEKREVYNRAIFFLTLK